MLGECFVISPIGESGSATRRHAELLLNHIIFPVMNEVDIQITRADKIDTAGLITTQIINKIISARLVIADLSEHNPNVFYELALRHAAHLPVVHMSKIGERLPFDIAGFRTIFFDLSDLDSVAEAKNSLRRQVESFDSDQYESPVSVAMNLQKLVKSSNPTDRLLSELLSEFSEMKSVIYSSVELQSTPNKFDEYVADSFIADLKNRVTLSRVIGRTVNLKKQGKEWRGFSPFRQEKTPSLYVNDQKQAWFDFTSGQNGNVIDWLMRTENLSFGDAIFRAIELKDHTPKAPIDVQPHEQRDDASDPEPE